MLTEANSLKTKRPEGVLLIQTYQELFLFKLRTNYENLEGALQWLGCLIGRQSLPRSSLIRCRTSKPAFTISQNLEGEGEVAFFGAKRWGRRNKIDLIESAAPYHDAQVVGLTGYQTHSA